MFKKLRNPVKFDPKIHTNPQALDAEIKLKNPELFGGRIEDYPTLPEPKGDKVISEIQTKEVKKSDFTLNIKFDQLPDDFGQLSTKHNVQLKFDSEGTAVLRGEETAVNNLISELNNLNLI